jgi:hypothetical protein
MSKNLDSFRAVFDALGGGSAVALFPEGISHSEPGLVPLKTGAARIALGAVATTGRAFPIIPVGLVFRNKDSFRSDAHATVGAPVAWDDLASKGADDHGAVRELTERIDRAMRAVTLNLARWEDEALVRTAEAVWASARDVEQSTGAHVARLKFTTDALATLRASGDARWESLAADVRDHARMLDALGMKPSDVEIDTALGTAARWAIRRLTVVGAAQFLLAAITVVLFWIPYRLTGLVAGLFGANKDSIATYKVFAGALLFSLWMAALAGVAGAFAGWWWALAVLALLPAIAVGGLYAAEHWEETFATARRWIVLRRRDPRIAELRRTQRELADRLDTALAAHRGNG